MCVFRVGHCVCSKTQYFECWQCLVWVNKTAVTKPLPVQCVLQEYQCCICKWKLHGKVTETSVGYLWFLMDVISLWRAWSLIWSIIFHIYKLLNKQYIEGGYNRNRDSLFTRNHKMSGNGQKSSLEGFWLHTRGRWFISHWNNCPKEVLDSPALDTDD